MQMKLKALLIVTAFFMIGGSSINAVPNSRLEWWKLQKKHLEGDFSRIQKDPLYADSLERLLSDDMRRCDEVLRVFKELSMKRGLLTESRGLPGAGSLNAVIDQSAGAVTDMLLLKSLVLTWNSPALAEFMIGPARRAALARAALSFQDDSKEIVTLFVMNDISQPWRKVIAREMLIQAMTREKVSLKQEIKEKLQAKAKKLLTGDEAVTSLYVKNLISREALKTGSGYILPLLISPNDNDLKGSATWKYFNALMDFHFTSFKEIKEMVKEEYPLGKIRYFFRDRSALDRQVFPGESLSKIKSENRRIYLHRRIDNLRRRALGPVRAANISSVVRQFNRKGGAVINQYLARQKAAIRHREKVIRHLEKKEKKNIHSLEALTRDLEKKKKSFREKEESARRYLQRSESFLTWWGEHSAMPRERVKKLLAERIRGSEKYIRIIGTIGEGASGFSGRENRKVQGEVHLSLRRLDTIYRAFLDTALPAGTMRGGLTARDIRYLQNLKRDLGGSIRETRNGIMNEYHVMLERRASLAEKRETRSLKRMRSIAQFEMDQVASGLKAFSRILAGLHYGEDILARYKLRVDALIASLARGEIPPETDAVLKRKSLLHLVTGYSRDRILSEGVTRNYLADELNKRTARVSGLVQFYRRHGIEIREYPSREELAVYRKLIGRAAVVTLAGRNVSLSNLHEADRSTAQYIRDLAVRNIWHEKRKSPSDGKVCRVHLEDRSITVSIPYGWGKLPGAMTLQGRPGIKEFLSLDGSSSITLAAIPGRKRGAKEVSRRWMIRRSSTMMTHRWGRKDASSFYWARGRDKHQNVFELYAFERDGHVVIIEGTSPGDKHALLTKKLKRVFHSVRY